MSILRFGQQERTELGLSPGPPEKNHHHAGNEPRNFPAKILLNQGQRQIDPRRDPSRGIDIAIADIDEIGIDAQRRVSGGETGIRRFLET
jgi:hypothetical protein